MPRWRCRPPRDASPVRVGAMDGGLHEAAADDGARDRPGVDVIARAADAAGDEGRGALAVGRLLARQRSGHGLDSAGEGLAGFGPRHERCGSRGG